MDYSEINKEVGATIGTKWTKEKTQLSLGL